MTTEASEAMSEAGQEMGPTERIEGSYMVSAARMDAIRELVEAAEAAVRVFTPDEPTPNNPTLYIAMARLRTALQGVRSET